MSTEATWQRHSEAIESGDIDRILADYANNAVVFNTEETFRGHDRIRAFFNQMLSTFTPEVMSHFRVLRQDIDGEVVYLVWTAGRAIPLGTETFVIRDDMIVAQTFAAHLVGSSRWSQGKIRIPSNKEKAAAKATQLETGRAQISAIAPVHHARGGRNVK